MAKAMSITQAEDKVRNTLNTLQQAHSKWNEQQRITDNMLYVLIEECVGFYRFAKTHLRQTIVYIDKFYISIFMLRLYYTPNQINHLSD